MRIQKTFVILDRDGTILVDHPYLSDPEKIEFFPNSAKALNKLQKAGFGLIVATNQSGIGRGFFTLESLEKVHERFRELLLQKGVLLDGIYVCPHAPEEHCLCRKPGTALIKKASRELNFKLKESYVIGDKRSDIEMGKKVGAYTIFLKASNKKYDKEILRKPDFTAEDLMEAAKVILTRMTGKTI